MTQHLPIQWHDGKSLPIQYQQLSVAGHFLPDVFLLDNQYHQHQLGYDVISPLQMPNGNVLLVDRGWVPSPSSRLKVPMIQTPTQKVLLLGSVYYPSKKSWLLGAPIEPKDKQISVIERIDTQLISQILHKSVYPFIIRLNRQAAFGYVREWVIVSMPPTRHYGYAVQWFAMAIAVLMIFIALNLKKSS